MRGYWKAEVRKIRMLDRSGLYSMQASLSPPWWFFDRFLCQPSTLILLPLVRPLGSRHTWATTKRTYSVTVGTHPEIYVRYGIRCHIWRHWWGDSFSRILLQQPLCQITKHDVLVCDYKCAYNAFFGSWMVVYRALKAKFCPQREWQLKLSKRENQRVKLHIFVQSRITAGVG